MRREQRLGVSESQERMTYQKPGRWSSRMSKLQKPSKLGTYGIALHMSTGRGGRFPWKDVWGQAGVGGGNQPAVTWR